jgi:cobalamin biosynthesis protein CobT
MTPNAVKRKKDIENIDSATCQQGFKNRTKVDCRAVTLLVCEKLTGTLVLQSAKKLVRLWCEFIEQKASIFN